MELFWYNIKEMDAAAYDAALSMMDTERRSRIGDFPNEDDRKRSAAGELLLRQAAAARLGCTAESAPLVWNENGKPGVEGAPFYVSVSHRGPYVVAAAGEHGFWVCWTAKEALFKLTGKGPLLALSRLQLPEGVALDHIMQNGCAVTAAMQL